ncbi:MAG: carboxy terminal-processing peptidase [Puniceicoccales bacterium]|jgi:carboxyl-terminal processing protease|nr:carboxy terminal-processing peptidase [Puniceicoccales bacterium]
MKYRHRGAVDNLRRAGVVLLATLFWIIAAPVSLANEVIPELKPTREMRAETIYMVRCMEEVHLEHKSISMLDNRAILLRFLEELDPWKMIFLQREVDALIAKFVPTLDIFVSGGSLMPAFTTFDKFRTIAYGRLNWIFERLERPFDFSVDETFTANRKDCHWTQTAEDADALWEKRLKYEILTEAISLCSQKQKKEFDSERESDWEYLPTGACESESEQEDESISYSEEKVVAMFDEAIKNIKRRYESLKRSYREMDPWLVQEMFLGSISYMYDPHTSFMSKDSLDDFNIRICNSLIGIGAELVDESGICTINKLVPGGPAKLSGEIKSGDKIVAIAQGDDGEFVDIVGLRLYKIVKLLRGEKDTVVRVNLETVTGDRKIVRLVRDRVKMNASRASAKYFELENDGKIVRIGVIELPSFYGDVFSADEQGVHADRDVSELLEILKQKKIDGLVFDVRQNGGGLLDQAISITGLFISSGPVVQVKNSVGDIRQFYDKNDSIAWEGPLVLLSSSMSASASEILIGALRDHRRVVVVGAEATYGKGSVQLAFDMNEFFSPLGGNKDLGAAYITIQKWYLPTGTSTQLKGVPSDIKLSGLDECFHRREADYPHALSWDTISSADFDQKKDRKDGVCYASDELIAILSERSNLRQKSLLEFEVFHERIAHFDNIINRKEFPLKICTRLAEKKSEEEFRNEMNAKIKNLMASEDYACQDIRLPDIPNDGKDCRDEKPEKDMDNIIIFDTNLRESLRIVNDWIELLQAGNLEGWN